MFDANHFHVEATLETTDSDKLSKHSSYVYKEGCIHSKVGSHIITGVPLTYFHVYILQHCKTHLWQVTDK